MISNELQAIREISFCAECGKRRSSKRKISDKTIHIYLYQRIHHLFCMRSVKGMYSVLGFSRCNKYIPKPLLPTTQINENSVESKRKLYNDNIKILDEIRKDYHIYLSKCDLENEKV